MLHLKDIEFNISHTCNLACDHCNHFSNFAFKGHQSWKDYESDYESWARIVDIESISIIGGEPTLNPSLREWMHGLRRLWPNALIQIATNGSRLIHIPEIIDECRKLAIKLKVSLHSKELGVKVLRDLNKILISPSKVEYVFRDYHLDSWQESYEKIRGSDWPDCNTPHEFISLPDPIKEECISMFDFSFANYKEYKASRFIIDDSGLRVELNWYDQFNESAIKFNTKNSSLTLHDSDPDAAISVCAMKFCHKFHQGQLYKCSLVANLPPFLKQFDVDVSVADADILNSYEPAKASWTEVKLKDFISNLNNGLAIPQCKFCPDSKNIFDLKNCTIKPKIKRKISNI